MNTMAILLAAGKGSRMKSTTPKVLHNIGGRTMVEQVIHVVERSGIGESILVVGHGADEVKEKLGDEHIYVFQEFQFGTGHAVMQALPKVEEGTVGVFVACADTPLLKENTLRNLKADFFKKEASCVILTTNMPNPKGYGRIIRDDSGAVTGIVEDRDATDEQRKISEVNTGTYFFRFEDLKEAIANLKNDNAQSEYYLTDTISYMVNNNKKVEAYVVDDWRETIGVNDLVQLAEATKILHKRKCKELMYNGVKIKDPRTTYIDMDVVVGRDTVIHPGTYLRDRTTIGKNCEIGPNTDIYKSIVSDDTNIYRSVVKESTIGMNVNIGPFAYIRPGSMVGHNVKIGDFVELKKTYVGDGSKIPHLSYIGDAHIGEGVNIGCGTITCNYDGKNKHRTSVGDNAFIGSNVNLVAPVNIGERVTVAAGSTITENVPDDSLAIARARQVVKREYAFKKNK